MEEGQEEEEDDSIAECCEVPVTSAQNDISLVSKQVTQTLLLSFGAHDLDNDHSGT